MDIPRTISVFEETEVTILLSCFLTSPKDSHHIILFLDWVPTKTIYEYIFNFLEKISLRKL